MQPERETIEYGIMTMGAGPSSLSVGGYQQRHRAKHNEGMAPPNRIPDESLKRKRILLTCGTYGNVIHFLAPLTIDEAHLSEAIDILGESIAAARAA